MQHLVEISSGTRGQLIEAYRREVEVAITSKGGHAHLTGHGGSSPTELHHFSYDYTWRGNKGIIRVYSIVGKDDAIVGKGDAIYIITTCYEYP